MIVADVAMNLLRAIVAFGSGSFTLLGEVVRSALMTTVEIFSALLLRGVHRGQFKHFEFGIGKVEQFAWLVFGLSLIAGGSWVAVQVVSSLGTTERAASPLGLTFAAIVNGINLLINGLSLHALVAASEEHESDVYRAQVLTRGIKLANSTVLQIVLTLAALSTDPLFALAMDAIGVSVAVAVMVTSGASMIVTALPALLDAPLSSKVVDPIRDALTLDAAGGSPVASIRSRNSGRFPQVEAAVLLRDVCKSDWEQQKHRIHRIVHDIDPSIELRITLAKEGGDETHPSASSINKI